MIPEFFVALCLRSISKLLDALFIALPAFAGRLWLRGFVYKAIED
ncbi:hypothetical protein TCARB_0739 [Thermofilum adornatum 1505]|uniref:Uncharacterized protein n=1 Tax=Thermofilum adornatum 1505 TaxID=697581 RepID=A0A3G1A8N4_9CREN|nr:hypothetical protein TCARB_0739 [Thermofilum adornatum 1505]